MRNKFGAPAQIRTETFIGLSYVTLPIGLQEHLVRMRGLEPPRGFPHSRLRTVRLPFRHIRINWWGRRDSNSHAFWALVPKTSVYYHFTTSPFLVSVTGFEPARRLPTLPSQDNATTHFATPRQFWCR